MQNLIVRFALGLSLLSPAAAHAATVTNRDAKDYKLTVLEGDKAQHLTLKPSGVLQDLCPKGCIVRLNDSENDEYELEGTEIVSIEDGYLYYDVPETGPGVPGPARGAGGAPGAPGVPGAATPPAGQDGGAPVTPPGDGKK